MKKINPIIISLSLVCMVGLSSANATIRIITAKTSPVEGFFPSVTNAVIGDTIKWVNGDGTHTTASTSIPSGAASWSSPVLTTAGFTYIVTVVGTYNYTCHPLTGGHMPGSIVVSASTGITAVDPNFRFCFAYPNPCTDKIIIETTSAEIISIHTIAGQNIKSVQVKRGQTRVEMDVADLPKGIYFIEISDGTKSYLQKIVVQ